MLNDTNGNDKVPLEISQIELDTNIGHISFKLALDKVDFYIFLSFLPILL